VSQENPRKPRFEIRYTDDREHAWLNTWRAAYRHERTIGLGHSKSSAQWTLIATIHRHYLNRLGSHEMAGAMVTCTGELLIIEADSVDHLFRVWNLVMAGADSEDDSEGVPDVPSGPVRLVRTSETMKE
jgi:hypothetical protein